MSAALSIMRRTLHRKTSLATTPPLSQQVALVTGANRGLGLEVVRQLAATGMTVLLGSRELALGEKLARQLRHGGGDVVALKLDVTVQPDIDAAAAAAYIENHYGRLDVLINNAGAYYDVGELPS
jgi:NAD(P)-dependent dehydrogenase (short-subunit alcohol dehydrogenase family)